MDEKLDIILQVVCEFYKVEIIDLQQKRGKAEVILPKQVYCYFAKKFTDVSLSKIGAKTKSFW